jgi:hypothetical protein
MMLQLYRTGLQNEDSPSAPSIVLQNIKAVPSVGVYDIIRGQRLASRRLRRMK